jgi:hypothetical protein
MIDKSSPGLRVRLHFQIKLLEHLNPAFPTTTISEEETK